MKSESFTGTVRQNKANKHKYVTVPKEKKIEVGEEVKVTPVEDDSNSEDS